MVTNGIEDFSTFFLDGRTLQKKAFPHPTDVIKAGELGNPSYPFMLVLIISPQTSTSSSEKTWEVLY